jgi:phenylacetate-coenzyme A ligase PaaK-like adenylate-forming protein
VPKSNALIDVQDWPVFEWPQAIKKSNILSEMAHLVEWHYRSCKEYSLLLDKMLGYSPTVNNLEDLPFLPVRLFKHERLLSVPSTEIIKTMTSSGTSGQSVSQIFLDKRTAAFQIKVLSRIMAEFFGRQRLPLLVIDCRATVVDRIRFSARTAGILGFSMFGRDIEYAFDDDMTLNKERIIRFLERHPNQDVLLFGFTFIIWQHFVQALEAEKEIFPLSRGILIHGGGWKQLYSQAVDDKEFKRRLYSVTQIQRVHNYYGMVEQTGSIFMECEAGHLHASVWSEVIIRDPLNFQPLPVGNRGLIQLISVVPHSYPGHSLLTEDEGEIIGVDNCACGRMGTYFKVYGRMESAEMRGCSDTYTQ